MPKVRTPENDAERIIQAYNRACGGCMRLDNPSNVHTANALIAITKSADDVINATVRYADAVSDRTFAGFAIWYRRNTTPTSVPKAPLAALLSKDDDIPVAPVHAVPAAPAEPSMDIKAYMDAMLEPLKSVADQFASASREIIRAEERRKDSDAAAVDSAMSIISGAVAENVRDTCATLVLSEVNAKIDSYIKDTYGTINRKITVSVNGSEPRAVEGILHEKFDTVLKYVQMDEPVFLVGAAGSGKNFLCKQVADALKLDFWFTNAVTQSYQITGFTDAMGKYQPTQFYHAFTEGGLFMLDEMDASIPEVLIILNAAIANRYFDFPAPIGRTEAHKDFRVIAAGNTYGHGADAEYVGRNQLDAASLDRFALVEIYYDAKIEEGLACGNDELLAFCREFRDAINSCGIHTVVSYRTIGRSARMLSVGMDINTVMETAIVKSLHKDDIDMVLSSGKLSEGKFKASLKKVARSKSEGR